MYFINSYIFGTNFYKTNLHTGTGAELSITGLGFQPDLTWIKNFGTSSTNHHIFTSERTATKYLKTNSQDAETTDTQSLKSFDAQGFTLGTSAATNDSSETYVSFNIEQKSGVFSMISYAGTGVAKAEAHGLGATPEMMIVKSYDTASTDWMVFHTDLTGSGYYLRLNAASAEVNGGTTVWNGNPDGTNINLGTNGNVNTGSRNYLALCFASLAGECDVGVYTGNGSTTGPLVVTGFEPAFVMIKRANSSEDWALYDNKTTSGNPRALLVPNLQSASAATDLDFNSNGFQPKATAPQINASGSTYVYLALKEIVF